MISLNLAMKTKAQMLTSLWLLMVLIGLLSQQHVQAGAVVQQQKQGKPKNSTVTEGKDDLTVNLKPKYVNKSKITTTTTSTTAKPKKDSVIISSAELNFDGRHAYINNQFVPDQEKIHDHINSPVLYEILQQQMESVLTNTQHNTGIYNGKEMIEQQANEPLFSYDINYLNDYNVNSENEEELTEQEEQQTDNCEDTEESFDENDDSSRYDNATTTNQQNSYSQTQKQNSETTAQSFYIENKASKSNKTAKGSYDLLHSNSSNYKGQANKSSSTHHHHKKQAPQKPQASSNQKTNIPLKAQENPKQSTTIISSKSQQNPKQSTTTRSSKSPENSTQANSNKSSQLITIGSSRTQKNPKLEYSNKPSQTSTTKPSKYQETPKQFYINKSSQSTTRSRQRTPNNYHKTKTLNKSSKSSIKQNNSKISIQPTVDKSLYSKHSLSKSNQFKNENNSNTNTVTPFSTVTSSGNSSGKIPTKRRHLTFRTVSSSTQFVSTPLGDLMLKLSIGLAKPSIAGVERNQSRIYNKNDKEMSS